MTEAEPKDLMDFATHVRWLLTEFPLIQGMDPDLQAKVPEILSYSFFEDDSIVLKQGELPERCYIVLSGEVMVLKKDAKGSDKPPKKVQGSPTTREHCLCIANLLAKGKEEEEAAARAEEEDGFSDEESPKATAPTSPPRYPTIVRRASNADVANLDRGAEEERSKFGAHIATLGSGIMFGEIGLLDDQPRNATIICRGDCEFLVIGRDDFDRVLKEKMKTGKVREFTTHVGRLLQEFRFVRQLDESVQRSLPEIVSYSTRPSDAVIFNQCEVPEQFYVLISGYVNVWQKGSETVESPEQGSQTALRHAGAITSMLAEDSTRLTRQASFSRQLSPCSPKLVKADVREEYGQRLATLGPGVILGGDCLLEGQQMPFSVTCQTVCELLVITRTDLETRLRETAALRTFARLRKCIEGLILEYPFFQDMDSYVRDRTMEAMRYESVAEGTVVFRQDDPPDKWFIVLSGKLGVYKRGRGESPHKAFKSRPARKMCNAILMRLTDDAVRRPEEKPEEGEQEVPVISLGEALGHKVGYIHAGELFGEAPFVGDLPRQATVKCLQDCEFVAVSKWNFEKALKAAELGAPLPVPKQCEPILANFPIFQNLPEKVRQRLPSLVRSAFEQRDALLCWQDDLPQRCYFLLEGEVAAWRRSDAASDFGDPSDAGSEAGDKAEPDSPTDEKLVRVCLTLAEQLAEVELQRRSLVTRIQCATAGVKNQGSKVDKQLNQVNKDTVGKHDSTMGAGTIIGELALLGDSPAAQPATLMCRSDCRMLVVERTDFQRLLHEEAHAVRTQGEKPAVRRLLRQFPMVQELAPVVQDALPDIVRCKRAKEGEVLCEHGQAPTCCYLILKGEIALWKKLDLNVVDGFESDEDDEEPLSSMVSPKGNDGPSLGISPQGQRRRSASGPEDEEEEKRPPPPPQVLRQVLEKCSALAAAIAKVSGEQEPSNGSCYDDVLFQEFGKPQATLGPGRFVGEDVLLRENPEHFTATCSADCELLVIERADCQEILRKEAQRDTEEKLAFLQQSVPGAKVQFDPCGNALRHAIRYFQRKSVPRNHVFFEQGMVGDGVVLFVLKGSVESYTHVDQVSACEPLRDTGFRRLGMLLQGSVLASPKGGLMPFTAVANSSPCEVLKIDYDDLRHLPDVMQRSLKELIDQMLGRRMGRAGQGGGGQVPGSAHGGAGGLKGPQRGMSPATASAAASWLQRPSTTGARIPKTLSSRGPQVVSPKPLNSARAATPSPKVIPGQKEHPFNGLFKRGLPEVDFVEFAIEPGESLAMTAQRPPTREPRGRHSGAHGAGATSPMMALEAIARTASVKAGLGSRMPSKVLADFGSRMSNSPSASKELPRGPLPVQTGPLAGLALKGVKGSSSLPSLVKAKGGL
eukprot:CAMPEP_0195065506 /NCGR_PEP_ID=MMETSP0448-20130528/11141_1 /TAXON_ID=66468 /ORGANISM="Heterocapsa triquestra, Strain CCMP 448" /LENGTH=1376 /DNA_ID=CAMNT_0040096615 /DNA_START=151 /DNA_END=4281 /DNA_ORIENTATION=+